MSARDVLDSLSEGRNCVAEAVPGGGKSTLLLSACEERNCLLLAYNVQLAEEMRARLPPGSKCTTFHSLCTTCLGTARDDRQMLRRVEAAERGEVVPANVPGGEVVLLDEAQDVRPLYVRLLAVCGLTRRQICVVGDRNQLVYDFDPTFPASLDTLLDAERVLGEGRGWDRVRLTVSYRLTAPMASLVNSIFGTEIRSERDGPPVEVRSCRSAFQLPRLLRDVLDEERDVLLLTDRKQGNRPLTALLNDCSKKGKTIAVHGVDAAGERGDGGTVRCGTFWSAKGLESEVVVALLPPSCARSPTYVALTRATRRLVVVLDARDPHAALCSAAASFLALPANRVVTLHDPFTASVVNSARAEGVERSLLRPERPAYPSTLGTNLDRAEADARLLAEAEETLLAPAAKEGGDDALSGWGEVAVRLALVRAEMEREGRVRHMEDVLSPTRLEGEAVSAAIRSGLVSRWVPRAVPDDSLLAPDLRSIATRAYSAWKGGGKDGSVEVTLACLAWDGFDHLFRRHLPVGEMEHLDACTSWFGDEVRRGGARLTFDTRLARDASHARVHATCDEHCLLLVWEASSSDEGKAVLLADLHPKKTCLLYELSTQRVRRFSLSQGV